MKVLFLGIAGALLTWSCTGEKRAVRPKVVKSEAAFAPVCPCLMTHVFPYAHTSGERRIAVHVFNLADKRLHARIRLSLGDRTLDQSYDVDANDRRLVTFSAPDLQPLERYGIRIHGLFGGISVDSLSDMIYLSRFEIDNLVRLDIQ